VTNGPGRTIITPELLYVQFIAAYYKFRSIFVHHQAEKKFKYEE